MSFKVENPKRVVQMATATTSTYYVGQLVAFCSDAGTDVIYPIPGAVTPLDIADNVADGDSLQIIAGVVVGFNNRTPVYSATAKANYATGVTAQADLLARDWALNKGMYAAGDPMLLVDVAIIDCTSVIEGPIYNDAYGTAPSLLTSTAAGADGWTTAGTTNACDFTPIGNLETVYCRSGANAGIYRVTNDSSTTAPDVTVAFPENVAIGDTFVRVPIKQGLSYMNIGGTDFDGLYINCSSTPDANYFTVVVEQLDLRVAGKEKAWFRFLNPQFCGHRA